MIILQMMGGLGNQMFQYAFYLQLKSLGRQVKIDDESGFTEDKQRFPALAPFGITYEKASLWEIRKMRDSFPYPWSKVKRKLFGRNKKAYFEESKLFMPQIFTWDDIYLDGFWQSEKYFSDVEEQVKEAFLKNVPNMLSKDALTYLSQIEESESVSVHIRRGDYLLPENEALFGNICTESYYENAVRQIQDKHPDCVFYLFTNDTDWGREWIIHNGEKIFGSDRVVLVETAVKQDYEALILMSRCKHNIIANSSFSWWASYLNENRDKLVMAPEVWLNGWDCRDIYRDDMIRVER